MKLLNCSNRTYIELKFRKNIIIKSFNNVLIVLI